MSIETLLKENTAAMLQLCEALRSFSVDSGAVKEPQPVKTEKVEKQADAVASQPEAIESAAEAPAQLPPLDVKDIVTAFRGYIQMHGNEKAAALLRKFGAGDKLLDKVTKQCTVPVERQREFFGACHD